jgi:hypothetical protein
VRILGFARDNQIPFYDLDLDFVESLSRVVSRVVIRAGGMLSFDAKNSFVEGHITRIKLPYSCRSNKKPQT